VAVDVSVNAETTLSKLPSIRNFIFGEACTAVLYLSAITLVIILALAHLPYFAFLVYSTDSNEGGVHKGQIPLLASELPAEQLCLECQSSKNVISGQSLVVGTNFADYMVGSTFNDIVFSKDGSDVVFLDLGTDRFYGGSKDDIVEGGPGNDQLFGEDGDDNLFGSFDDDLLEDLETIICSAI
jgi:hypothetical protein